MPDICKKCGQLIGDHSYGRCPGTIGAAAALLGAKGGKASKGKTSPAKAAASAANGRKGGRPRKITGPSSAGA